MDFVLHMYNILIFSLSYTVQGIIFIIISRQASYPCVFTQLIPNITCKQPPQHTVPTPCTVRNSSVSTFLPWNCFLLCHMKCVVVNLDIYNIISSLIERYDNEIWTWYWRKPWRKIWGESLIGKLCSYNVDTFIFVTRWSYKP